jgi:hypothetical protein
MVVSATTAGNNIARQRRLTEIQREGAILPFSLGLTETAFAFSSECCAMMYVLVTELKVVFPEVIV